MGGITHYFIMKFSICCVGPMPLTPSPPVLVSAAPRGALAPGTRGASTAARAHTGHPVGSRFCLWPRAAATRQASFHDLAFRGIGVRPRGKQAMGTWPLVTTGSGVVFGVPHVLHRVRSLAGQIQLLKAVPPTPPC